MKKIIITTLAVLLAGLCNIMPYAAAENPVVSVSSTVAMPGETVEVTVDLSNCDTGFTNIAIEVGYDADVLELVSAKKNELIKAGFTPAPKLTKNPYNMSWQSSNNTGFTLLDNDTETFATMQFRVKETATCGTYPITVKCFKGRNSDYIDGKSCNYIVYKGSEDRISLNLQYQNGSITVTDQNIISASNISFGSTKTEFSVNAVALSEYNGKLIAAFKDENGVMKAVRMYDAQPTTIISYDGACDYAEVMWWDMNLITPIADPITVNG